MVDLCFPLMSVGGIDRDEERGPMRWTGVRKRWVVESRWLVRDKEGDGL
jgi:hypothetical protein